LGSFIASTILEDYKQAEEIIKQSLRSNPKDTLLLNNLAFTYASSGRIRKAKEVLKSIGTLDGESSLAVTVKATRGLIAFRSGRRDEGRSLYLEAIEESKRYERSFQALAALSYAREEIFANTAMRAKAIALALTASSGVKDKNIAAISQKIVDLQNETIESSSIQQRRLV
jgi:tetratricopeptide (TPR) repeat protein